MNMSPPSDQVGGFYKIKSERIEQWIGTNGKISLQKSTHARENVGIPTRTEMDIHQECH
jgi:hypothetical protein